MPNTREKLIDAKPLMQNGWHLVRTGESNTFLASMSLADVPTVDAVEVVRCKDCKHYLLPQGFCKHDRHDYQTMSVVQEDDDFCSYGERREGE